MAIQAPTATPTSGISDSAVNAAVERTRAMTGLMAVVAGDIAIAVAAVLGIIYTARGSAPAADITAILSGGFTAIGTMTTAYFGIKSISNTASSLAGTLHAGSPSGATGTTSTSGTTGTTVGTTLSGGGSATDPGAAGGSSAGDS